ncbi:EAL and HDOD domain-containing protein [Desulfonatronum thiodismutans]|uniref:EAL and HDOD domain-containing protein n=1 Tax=Desulfonatronum thiodismutans TaxID=159290 RepID=UPI0006919D04|nr:HDOD domain-containing protein [Desulfonatronum thiodismutans]
MNQTLSPQQKTTYLPIFIGRQTVYDTRLNVWGHELLFRSGGTENVARFSDPEQATAMVITEGFSMATESIPKGRKIFINYPKGLLLKNAPLALPREDCVIEVLETVEPTPEIIAALSTLKDNGYTIALDDYVGQPGYDPLLKLADIIKVDLLGRPWTEIIKIGQKLHKYKCLLLAEKVEDRPTLELATSLGFSFFQGFFFSRPEIITGRSIPTAAVNRIRLIHELSAKDFEVSEVAKIISQDPGMSFRLLKHINSVFYSFRHNIRSIAQAVTLMGSRAVKQWAMLSMLADLGSEGKIQELLFSSVHRARFLEILAAETNHRKNPPDTMFLLGLFSNLDAMLNLPMEDILVHLPLEKEISAALCGEENFMRQWIKMTIAVERGDWASVKSMIDYFRLDEQKTALNHLQAADWAYKMLFAQQADEEKDEK